MAKYRKKPIVVEAEQWHAGDTTLPGMYRTCGTPCARWFVDTLEGPLRVSPDDWIITGIKGERYPVKPDIFEATYELVELEPSRPTRTDDGYLIVRPPDPEGQ